MTALHALAPSIAGGAVNSLLLGLGIAFVAQFLMWSIARRHSAVRFALLYSALVAIVAAFFWRAGDQSAVAGAGASAIALPSRWALYFVFGWAAIAAIGLVRIGVGLWHLQSLRKNFVRLDNVELESLLRAHRRRDAALFVSDDVRVPTAFGFFRPAIVLPRWSVSELSRQELRTTVLHELAHVDRWDDWTNLGQKVIRALLFFHPAVWWIDSRLGIERETSCDDAVLAQSNSPQSYAECLVSIAEKSFLQKQIALTHAAVGHVKQTAFRIAKILDGRKRQSVSTWKPALVAVTSFSLLGGIAAEHAPSLVRFQDSTAFSAPVSVASSTAAYHPRVVPVSMTSAPAVSKSARRVTSAPRRAVLKSVRKPDIQNYVASQNDYRRPGAKPVNASTTETTSPQFMFVVFQTRAYDPSGIVTVTTTVWRMRMDSNLPQLAPLPHST
jgi:beta-lactamase regulating signal transducer with metallopeptidase domain